jgi:tRNA A-37 threonylcarbamoyl transferase component Bud32
MQSSDCRTRETLKRYLAGWIEQDECDKIEAHVLSCVACEQTISGLESDPDTLVNFLRPEPNSLPSGHEQAGAKDAVILYALAKSKSIGHQPDALPSVSVPEKPPKFVGPYELIESLGNGSMGAVYLARHRQLGKQVAIKLLSPRPFRNDQFTARFQREIRAAGALNHPSIISATDAGQSDNDHFLVMEYIDGMDLSRLARLTGPFSIANACSLMHSVALGLSHAHAAGIVHRDIKPSNLMLSRSGQVKILDFGLAQISLWDEASAELTTVGQLMGTIDYMAPEQAERADSVDYRADLYSLGATLFKLLCGRAPLAATPDLSPLTKLRLLATTEPPSLSTLRPDAPAALVGLVSSFLARDPSMRPASAAHAAEMLAKFTSEADLSSLMREADERAVKEPMRIAPPLTSLGAPEAATPAKTAARGGSGPFLPWVATAAAFAFLFAAGVFITLETQKGQLVIESIDANVEIKVSKAGKVYDSVQLLPGANSTRLFAGNYEVSIGTGSDRFQLDRDTIEIKRGETVIARVLSSSKHATTSPPVPTNEIASTEAKLPAASETVYDGKTLSMWLDEFDRERSEKAIQSSLEAIQALATTSNRDRIAEAMLASLPSHSPANDYEAFTCIREIIDVRENYERHLVKTLDAKNETWTQRVLQSSTRPGDRRERVLSVEQLPIMDWIAKNTLSANSSTSREIVESAGVYVWRTLTEMVLEQSLETEYINLISTHSQLGPGFWLQFTPLPHPFAYAVRGDFPWNPRLVSLSESKATTYFLDMTSSEKHVAQSAMLLTSLLSDSDSKGRKRFDRSAELIPVLAKRLHELAKTPQLLHDMIDVDQVFGELTVPAFKLPQFIPMQLGTSVTVSSPNPAKCILVLELLDLIERLQATDACMDDIRLIQKATEAKAIEAMRKLTKGQPTNPRAQPNPLKFTISWPSATSTINGAQVVSKQEILAIAICGRAESFLPTAERDALHAGQKKHLLGYEIIDKMDSLDKNTDGFLSKDEAPFANFDTIDVNGDEQLSKDEFLEHSMAKGIPQSVPQSNLPSSPRTR